MWPFGRTQTLGPRGEYLARKFLKRRGMKILATNYRCRAGEADLIVLDPATRREFGAETIAVVEVKTRSSDKYTDPQSAVNAEKQRRLKRIADTYLTTHDTEQYNLRFDIVAVVIRQDEKPEINYIPNAFS